MTTKNRNLNRKDNKKSLADTILTTVGLTTKIRRELVVIYGSIALAFAVVFFYTETNPPYNYARRIKEYNRHNQINKDIQVISSFPCPHIITGESTPIDYQVQFTDGTIGLYHEKSLGQFDVYFQETRWQKFPDEFTSESKLENAVE